MEGGKSEHVRASRELRCMSRISIQNPAGDYVHHPVLGETHDYRNYNL